MEIPGTIIAGSVRERNSGGGTFRVLLLADVWAAMDAAAAL